jgi:uncharacterized protein (DUF58 family)
MFKRLLYFSFSFYFKRKSRYVRRFTGAGLLVLAALVASAVVGLDTAQTVAYQIFTFLLFLFIGSLVWGFFFRARFSAERRLPRFGTVGERLHYRVIVENRTGNKQTGLHLLENLEHFLPTFEEFVSAPEPDQRRRNPLDRALGYHRWQWLVSRKQGARFRERPVPPLAAQGGSEVHVEMVPTRRGHLRWAGLTIACPDPLGLFKAFHRISARQSVLVLPRRYSLPPIELPGTRRYQPGGVSMASSVGDSQEFMSMREYRPGDPLRRIHWRSWAKTGKPVVKEYQDEFFVRHALILDTFQEVEYSERFEEAVSVASSFVSTMETQETLLDLMFVGTEAYCFTSGRGLASTDKMLEILASVGACRDKPFDVLPPLVLARASLLSGCICVLLSWDGKRQELIGLLNALGIPLLVLVITDRTNTQALDPGPMHGNPRNLVQLRVGNIQERLARL